MTGDITLSPTEDEFHITTSDKTVLIQGSYSDDEGNADTYASAVKLDSTGKVSIAAGSSVMGDTASVSVAPDGTVVISGEGAVEISGNPLSITGLQEPTNDSDAATKAYVDQNAGGAVTTNTVTLSSSGWTESGNVYTQTATISGIAKDETEQIITVTPSTVSIAAFGATGVYASAQDNDTITFTATTQPTESLTVYVMVQNL